MPPFQLIHIRNEGSDIIGCGRDADGKVHTVRSVGFKPYIYSSAKFDNFSITVDGMVVTARLTPVQRYRFMGYTDVLTYYIKLEFDDPKYIPPAREKLRALYPGAEICEADIVFTDRFLADRNITAGGWVDLVDKQLVPYACEDTAPLVLFAFDIECLKVGGFPDPDVDPVIQISCVDGVLGRPGTRGVVFVVRTCAPMRVSVDPPADCERPYADIVVCDSEVHLLMSFKKWFVETVDPDFITGWNVCKFDFTYLLNRAESIARTTASDEIREQMESFCKLGRDGGVCVAKIVPVFTKQKGQQYRGEVRMNGRIVVDGLPFVIGMFYKRRSYKLGAVSKKELDVDKLDVAPSQIAVLHNGSDADRGRLATYCFMDSMLAWWLMQKFLMVQTVLQMSRVTSVMPFDVINRGVSLRVFLPILREANASGFIVPYIIHDEYDLDGTYVGATVFDPLTGLHFRVVVLDFNSLYPNSMITYNLCYTTYVSEAEAMRMSPEERAAKLLHTPHGDWFYRREIKEGVVPRILTRMVGARKTVQTQQAGQETIVDRCNKEIKAIDAELAEIAAWSTPQDTEDAQDTHGKREREREPEHIGADAPEAKRARIDDTEDAPSSGKRARADTDVGAPASKRARVDDTEDTPLSGKRARPDGVDIDADADAPAVKRARVDHARVEELRARRAQLALERYRAKFLADVLNSTQAAIKVVCNTMYGFTGSKQGRLPSEAISASTTAYGRHMVELTKQIVERESVGAKVIYGDSVSAETPCIVRRGGHIEVLRIDEIGRQWVATPDGKEVGVADCEVWSDMGWTPVLRVFRHRTDKRMYEVTTHVGSVRVTEDHSLLDVDGTPVQPHTLAVGSRLLHAAMPHPTDAWEVSENEAWIMGFSCAERVPPIILNASVNARRAFIAGYCRGDGAKTKTNVSIGCAVGACGLYYLFASVGYSVSVSVRKHADKPDIYRLNCTRGKQRKDPNAVKVIRSYDAIPNAYVYDLETGNHHFHAGVGRMIVHNTDSVMIRMPEGMNIEGAAKEGLRLAPIVTSYFEAPSRIAFEKAYNVFLLFAKKRYSGLKYMYSGKELQCKGIATSGLEPARRDNFVYMATLISDVLSSILNTGSYAAALALVHARVAELVRGRVPMHQLIMTGSVGKALDEYSTKSELAHVALARKLDARDHAAYLASTGDRLAMVFLHAGKGATLRERVETPRWALDHGLYLDYMFYVSKMEEALMRVFIGMVPPLASVQRGLYGHDAVDVVERDPKGKVKPSKRAQTFLRAALFEGEHMRHVVVPPPPPGPIARMFKPKQTCVECGVPVAHGLTCDAHHTDAVRAKAVAKHTQVVGVADKSRDICRACVRRGGAMDDETADGVAASCRADDCSNHYVRHETRRAAVRAHAELVKLANDW